MSLDEARAVLWLSNDPRPLGELLDNGYLDKHRLAWAAQKAYDPRLKVAAGVLLQKLAQDPATTTPPAAAPSQPEPLPAIEAGISLAQARTVVWPFRPHKGERMGELVDAQQLSLKDLAFAVENAWDERVRQAAIVLMAVRLKQAVKQPASPAGPLKVISHGRSYSEARQFQWTAIEGALAGALGTLCVLGVIWAIRSFTWRPTAPALGKLTSPVGLAVLLVVVALAAAAVWLTNRLADAGFKKLEGQIANYRKGQEGEEQVVELLRQNLDGRWTLFRNVVLPGRNKADIDGVLVGAPGIWALEIKALTGDYRNTGERWEYRAGKDWRPLKKSPSRQAQNNAARLASFLKADGITQWVTPAVIWANPESPLSVENPMAAVWTADRLPEELGNLWQGRDMGEADRTRTVAKLTALCRNNNED